MLAPPINVLLFGALVGVLLCYGRHARFGRALALTAILLLAAAATLPVGVFLIAPLENRFPMPPSDLPSPEGIIVLGGAINDGASAARGETVFDEGGERLNEAVGHAKEGVAPEAGANRGKSPNSDENARFPAAIVHPQASQRWIIVTSAFHMPRAMGVFEKAGFHPIAYPVSFYTIGRSSDGLRLTFESERNLRVFEIALHEWIGLAAYWATGRIDHLFPGPGDNE